MLLAEAVHTQRSSGFPRKIGSITEIQVIIKMKLKGHGKKMCEKKLEPEKGEADSKETAQVSVLWVCDL